MPGAEVKPGLVRCQAVHELAERGERRAGAGEPSSCEGGQLAEQDPSGQTGYCAPEIARASPCRPRP